MADTEETKPQQEAQAESSVDDASEESAWPGWLSWLLVIAAGVFGGYLWGARGTGSADQTAIVRYQEAVKAANLQTEQVKTQFRTALEVNQYGLDERMKSFCREMIFMGLFRDGLDEAMKDLTAKVGKTIELLGAAGIKPEDRLTQAGSQLKDLQAKLAQVSEDYGKHIKAVKRVGEIGTTDRRFHELTSLIARLYYDRTRQLMREVTAGNTQASRQAGTFFGIVSQLDPNMAAELGKQFPNLLAPSTAPSTAPAAGSAP
jgi:hypothetical protein